MKQKANLILIPSTNLEQFSTSARLNQSEQLLIKGGNQSEETTAIVSEELIDH